MHDTTKYYMYISDAKLSMFYNQIPKGPLKSIAAELNINLSIFGSGIMLQLKKIQPEEVRYARVKLISKYIEKYLDVGSVDTPGNYFIGTLEMAWGVVTRQKSNDPEIEIAVFRGETEKTRVVLTGSPRHLLGNEQVGEVAPVFKRLGSQSTVGWNLLVTALQEDHTTALDQRIDLADKLIPPPNEKSPLQSSFDLSWKVENNTESQLGWPKQRVEFLARTLAQGPPTSPTEKHSLLLLGTPIYIALSDAS